MVCQNYLTGFCPDGLNCPNGHPKYELPVMYNNANEGQNSEDRPPLHQLQQQQQQQSYNHSNHQQDDDHPKSHQNKQGSFRKLEDVTCYKCGMQGHYANRCPQGRNGPPK